MEDRVGFEVGLKRKLEYRASEVKASDELLENILTKMGDNSEEKRHIYKGVFFRPGIREYLAVSLCGFIVMMAILFTVSGDMKAMAMEAINKVKMIFVVEKIDGKLQVVEKPISGNEAGMGCAGQTLLGDDELRKKMGVAFSFPGKLAGDYNLQYKAEGIWLGGVLVKNSEAHREIQSKIFQAINDPEIYDSLKGCRPSRDVLGFYQTRNSETKVVITVDQRKMDIESMKGEGSTQVKVGNSDAYWREFSMPDDSNNNSGNGSAASANPAQKPKGSKLNNKLCWAGKGCSYSISTVGDNELTMEQAIALAEDFMKAQK